ncbi:MAG: LysM domain-containing protein [Acidimicrobiia bacterium]
MTISASTPLRVVVLLTSVALALLLLLAGITVAARAESTSAGDTVTAQIEHRVTAGDTLWDIAAEYTDPGEDIRETIHDIMRANGLDSSVIVVGQVLVVPLDF